MNIRKDLFIVSIVGLVVLVIGFIAAVSGLAYNYFVVIPKYDKIQADSLDKYNTEIDKANEYIAKLKQESTDAKAEVQVARDETKDAKEEAQDAKDELKRTIRQNEKDLLESEKKWVCPAGMLMFDYTSNDTISQDLKSMASAIMGEGVKAEYWFLMDDKTITVHEVYSDDGALTFVVSNIPGDENGRSVFFLNGFCVIGNEYEKDPLNLPGS